MTLDDPDDKRAYFQRIVDDIKAQIRDGRLDVNSAIPSAREMATLYGVASMTAQRALRELQQLRLTYGIPGRGTFVHPDAVDLLRGNLMRESIGEDDPALRQQVADYLATQHDLFRAFHAAATTADRDQIINDLVQHADRHRQLIDQMARYQTAHGHDDGLRRDTATTTTEDSGESYQRHPHRAEDNKHRQDSTHTMIKGWLKVALLSTYKARYAGARTRSWPDGHARTPNTARV